jgi:hypothetical protein
MPASPARSRGRSFWAVVATSAADAEWWIGSRVPDGERLKGELAGLVTDLQKRDTIGQSLQAARKWASDQIWAFAGVAVGGTWPAWATAAAAGAAAWLTGAAAADEETGEAVLPVLLVLLLTSGGFAVYTLRFSGLLISKASETASGALDYLTEKAGGLGRAPEAVLESYVRPALMELFTQHGRASFRPGPRSRNAPQPGRMEHRSRLRSARNQRVVLPHGGRGRMGDRHL